MTDSQARAMTDQLPRPWYWELVKNPGFIPEYTLEGPDVLCRYWHDKPPSSDALLIAAAPETAAEHDRLLKVNAGLVEALEFFFKALDEEWLVRNIEKDAEPDWAIKSMPWVQGFAKAINALGKARQP